MLQVISNACATQAILSVLLNTPDVELGGALTDLKSFTADFPPALRGVCVCQTVSSRLTLEVHHMQTSSTGFLSIAVCRSRRSALLVGAAADPIWNVVLVGCWAVCLVLQQAQRSDGHSRAAVVPWLCSSQAPGQP